MDSNKLNYLNAWIIGFLLLVLVSFNANGALLDKVSVNIEAVDHTPDSSGAIRLRFIYSNLTNATVVFSKIGTALEGGVFEDLLEVSKEGVELSYIGPIIKRLPPQDSDTVRLNPGQSISQVVEIHQAYDFSSLGSYKVLPKVTKKQKSAIGKVPVLISVVTEIKEFKQTPSFTTCDGTQQRSANRALSFAELYAAQARNALSSTPSEARLNSPRYKAWFGAYDHDRWNRVQTNFVKIASGLSGQTIRFNCACNAAGIDKNRVVAYVYKSRHYEVNLCPIFFRMPADGVNSQGGVLIHEMSHFTVVSNTSDHVYGRSAARHLASTNPARAITNADSYELFAENPGNLSMVADSDGGSSSPGGEQSDPIEPEPEPESNKLTLPAIIQLLFDDEVTRPPLELPEFTDPAIPDDAPGKFNAELELFGTFSEANASRYKYSQLNSHVFVDGVGDRRIWFNIRGFGVDSDDIKTIDFFQILLYAPNNSNFVKGSFNNAGTGAELPIPVTGAVTISPLAEEVNCKDGKVSRYRIFDIKFVGEALQRLKMDFLISCKNDQNSYIKGAVNYDASKDDIEIEPFKPNIDGIYPELLYQEYSGASFSSVNDNIHTNSEPIVRRYSIEETKIFEAAISDFDLRLRLSLPEHQVRIVFSPPKPDARPIVTKDDFVGSFPYLLGGWNTQIFQPGGQLNLFPEYTACESTVSDLLIHELQYQGSVVEKLRLELVHLCQTTGDRHRLSLRIDTTLPPRPVDDGS